MWPWKLDWESLGWGQGFSVQVVSANSTVVPITHTLLRFLQDHQHEVVRGWHVFLLSSQKVEGPNSSRVAHHWHQVMIMQPQWNRPLHEHHTPTRFSSSQFCPWNQLCLDTRKWAGLWDMWISHPPKDSHNHWQYACNLLEETAVNGFHVHWKWQNLHVWKTSSSPQKGAPPEDALYHLPWILRKRVCTLASRRGGTRYHWQKDLAVLNWIR